MKVPVSWLREHLATEATTDTIAEKLTMIGLQVEGIEDRAKGLAPFVVGYVVEAMKHPNADRLKVCRVDTGKGVVQVVCGAPNARTGMKGVFAPPGTHIPGTGLDLKAGKIRGEDSNGMLCSERELGLSDEHGGIIELAEDAKVGTAAADALGVTDAVIDVSLTPNRGDCAGIRGIARDLAAAGLGTLKPLDAAPVRGTFESPVKWRRDFPDGKGDACPAVAGRYFRKLKNGPSPQWMQDRLRAVGLRPISALVDITNYVTFDLGRPLHVFDAGTIAGDLTMRLARAGETIGALDGRTYTLDDEITVIADSDGVQGIAGVMGGEGSGCGDDTTSVFLEVALFDPIRTAASGRRLGIESDARYRFERGIDPTSLDWGIEVATRLILSLCGGEASEIVLAGDRPDWRRPLALRPARVAGLGGVHLPPGEPKRILAALGCEVSGDDETLHVIPPPWRADIEGEADLVEEVLRIAGFETIPPVPVTRPTAVSRPALNAAQRRIGDARRALAARGLVEAVTYSFLPRREAELFGGAPADLTLTNPISADLDQMRPSVLPNLVAAAKRNADRGIANAALFEVGPAYEDATPKGQRLVAGGLRAGEHGPRHWEAKPRPVDAFDAKADALAALGAMGAPVELGGGRSRRGRLVPPWPVGHAPPRPERAGPVRRVAPQNPRGDGGGGPDRGVRGIPRQGAGAAVEGHRPAVPQTVALPAGRARFRLRGLCVGAGGGGAARRQGGGAQPDHRRGAVRPLRGRGRRRRQEIGRHLGPPAACRSDLHRGADRRHRGENRRRRPESHRRDAAVLNRRRRSPCASRSSITLSPGAGVPCSARCWRRSPLPAAAST